MKCADGMLSGASCSAADNQKCAMTGQTAVAMCVGGQWSQCGCGNGTMTGAQTMAPGGTMTGAGGVAQCGNNKAEGDEVCDGTDLKGMTCATLNMGNPTALLKCNGRCMFDTTMCFAATTKANGGTGAATGGTGARTMGTAGSGGSGR